VFVLASPTFASSPVIALIALYTLASIIHLRKNLLQFFSGNAHALPALIRFPPGRVWNLVPALLAHDHDPTFRLRSVSGDGGGNRFQV
jgi:hypothetical protein